MELTAEELAAQVESAAGKGVEAALPAILEKMDEKIALAVKPVEPEPEGDPAPNPDDNKATQDIWVKDVKELRQDKAYMASGGYDYEKGGLGLFVIDVARASTPGGVMCERLAKWQAVTKPTMQEGVDEQGGFLVPADLGAHIRATSLEANIAEANGARTMNLAGNRINISADVDVTHVGNFFGGVTIYRPAEGATKTTSKPTYRQITLTLHKLAALIDVTDELIEDAAMSIQADLNWKVPAAIEFTKDDDFINGTGVGMALGLLSAITPGGPVISVAARPAQAAATIIFENVIDMWSRLHSVSQSNAIWMLNHGCFPQLATMNLAVGAGGGPVWIPPGGASASPYGTLMGRPVRFTEKCQALGTQGDIILADWRRYLIAQKAGGIQTASSIHLYFNYDKTVFRFVLRYDGQPSWAIDLTPRRGPTVSPFVVLATRA